MSESPSNHRVAIAIALIGVLGTLGAALIGNWDKIFPPRRPVAVGARPAQQPEITRPPAPTPTTVLRSEQDQVVGYKWVSDGPGLIVFEIDYKYDPAHKRPMYVRVIVYSEAEGTTVSGKPKVKVIAEGLSDPLTPDGKVRVDARKLLAQPAVSWFVEVALQEDAVPVNVKHFPLKRRWGPA